MSTLEGWEQTVLLGSETRSRPGLKIVLTHEQGVTNGPDNIRLRDVLR